MRYHTKCQWKVFWIYRFSTTSQVHVILPECWGLWWLRSFPKYTPYTSGAGNSMLATRWFRCFHLKECFASPIGYWKSNGGCPHVAKIFHDLPMFYIINSSIRSDALQCNADVGCCLLAFCCSWTGGAYCCRGRETRNIFGGSSFIKLSTSIHQNWSRLNQNCRMKTIWNDVFFVDSCRFEMLRLLATSWSLWRRILEMVTTFQLREV